MLEYEVLEKIFRYSGYGRQLEQTKQREIVEKLLRKLMMMLGSAE